MDSSNPAFFQDKDTLYLAGGYVAECGWDPGSHIPFFPPCTCLLGMRLSPTMAMSLRRLPTRRVRLVQAAGGELLKLDDGMFYLVGGHVFTGAYRDFEAAAEKNTPTVSQRYTGRFAS